MSYKTWYANIDTANIGVSGNGSTAYPWDVVQLKNYMNNTIGTPEGKISDYETIKLKGNWNTNGVLRLYNATTFSAVGVTIDAWDAPTYGPWKMKSTDAWVEFTLLPLSGNTVTLTIKNAVIGEYTIDNGYISGSIVGIQYYIDVKNSILLDRVTYNKTINASVPDNFYGSTFVNGSFENWDYYYAGAFKQSRVTFYDSVFYAYDLSASFFEYPGEANAQFTFDGCIFSGTPAGDHIASSGAHIVNIINCQFNWTPPITFPSYNSISISAKNNLLYQSYGLNPTLIGRNRIGINDYRKGIFGEPRQGKGAFYFSADDNKIYFDLGSNTSGYGNSANPFPGSEFEQNILSGNGSQFENEIYCMKGLRMVSAATSVSFFSNYGPVLFTNISGESWKLVLCGNASTVQIGGQSFSFSSPNIQNGIIHFDNGIKNVFQRVDFMTIKNMFLLFNYGSYPSFYSCGSMNLNGSTISSPTSGVEFFSDYPHDPIVKISDTILDTPYFNLRTSYPSNTFSLKLSGCVLTAPTVSALDALSGTINYRLSKGTSAFGSSITTSACQFNWVPPTWPSDNAINKSDYAYSVLTTANPITISGTGNWN